MKRRQFITQSLLATGGLFCLPKAYAAANNTELVILRGGSPAEMLDLGLEALGDLSRFIKPGQKILVKPTMRWNQPPESGQNTNPELLASLVRRCYEAGSRGVFLVDQTQDKWTKCYKTSGIERMVKDAGAKILPGNKDFLYPEVDIPNARVMKHPKIHELVQEVDLIINVPAAQILPSNEYFGAFHNLKGLIWDADQYQQEEAQSMLDLLHYKKPSLNIMDAYRVATPQGVQDYKSLIISRDIVSAEAYTARRLGIDPDSLPYIGLAAQAGFGKTEQAKEHIRSIVLKNTRQ
ncbi:DUF362 domain-containing protein [Sunxiuqinia sp. sy24]|uniref:DUF362 domain-containing protein n=1 Tax=Sunxiuqinia sp. sy24 TaxID=3461495 RepID=UPI0040451B0F